jgi:hypothetical protein
MEDKLVVPHFANVACKFGKELNFYWSNLYQSFAHDDYSHFPFDQGIDLTNPKKSTKILPAPTFTKLRPQLAILPCAKIVGVLVQQEDVSNCCLTNARDQTLDTYQLEDIHEKYSLPTSEVYMTTQCLNNARAKHKWSKVLKDWETLGKSF